MDTQRALVGCRAGDRRCCAPSASDRLIELVEHAPPRLSPDAELEEVARLMADFNLTSAPVVDEQDRMIGVVTVDDVLEVMLPKGWRRRFGLLGDGVGDELRPSLGDGLTAQRRRAASMAVRVPPVRKRRVRSATRGRPRLPARLSARRARLLVFLGLLGPGLIAANAGNDAGGIATYSVGRRQVRLRRCCGRWC